MRAGRGCKHCQHPFSHREKDRSTPSLRAEDRVGAATFSSTEASPGDAGGVMANSQGCACAQVEGASIASTPGMQARKERTPGGVPDCGFAPISAWAPGSILARSGTLSGCARSDDCLQVCLIMRARSILGHAHPWLFSATPPASSRPHQSGRICAHSLKLAMFCSKGVEAIFVGGGRPQAVGGPPAGREVVTCAEVP